MGQVSIGGKTFDVYGELSNDTVSDSPQAVSATTYFLGQLNTTNWDAASSTDRAKALVTASTILDKQRWVGEPTDKATPQALAWPRTGVVDCDGDAVATDEIPADVVHASYELAKAILDDATVQTATSTGSNTKRVLTRKKVGDLETEDETEYFSPTNVGQAAGTRFPAIVQEYLKCFIGGTLQGATVTGSQESVFLTFDYSVGGNGNI